MKRVGLLLVTIAIGLAEARILPNRGKQVKAYAYVLPAGAEEIRDDINHSFVCANRTDGFYVDVDNDCQIFHRCQDRARFSFICAEKTVFSQMYQTCVHEGQLGYPCEDSPMFYPEGEQPEQQPEVSPVDEQEAPAKASMPSQELLPPKETGADGQDAEDEKVGSLNMPVLSDNFVHENYDHHQVNDDTFDSVEEVDNTAQEVVDGQTSEVQASEVAAEEQQDSTQEVEVSEDDSQVTEDKEEQNTVQDAVAQTEVQESEPVVLVEDNHVDVQSELQNDEQTVEESEPVVQEVQQDDQPTIAVEVEVPQAEQTSEDDASSSNNEVQSYEEVQTQEKTDDDATVVQSEQPIPEAVAEIESHYPEPVLENEVVSEIELHDASHESSEPAKVSEPLVLATEVTQDRQQSEPAVQQEEEQQQPSDAAALAIEGSPVARTADLPEFIVSTVADLRKGVPAPPLRRRKTFLFKADART